MFYVRHSAAPRVPPQRIPSSLASNLVDPQVIKSVVFHSISVILCVTDFPVLIVTYALFRTTSLPNSFLVRASSSVENFRSRR
jgi:hypothetical protein